MWSKRAFFDSFDVLYQNKPDYFVWQGRINNDNIFVVIYCILFLLTSIL